jgi:hypothetical protein
MEYEVLDVDSQHPKIEQHLRRVAEGSYCLPEFQRTFVWDDDRIQRLWDSLYRGFPIGQLMLWEPYEMDFPMRGLGRAQVEIEAKKRGLAIIDGQQRLTALFLVLTGDTPLRFDLANEAFVYSDGPNMLRLDILRDAAGRSVPFTDAAGRQFFYIHASEAQKASFGRVINYLNGILTQRELPSQIIKGADYPTVLGVFKRLNLQGERLNDAQLTMAEICRHWPGVFRKTYDLLRRMNVEMGYDQADDPTFVFLVWTAVHTGQHLLKHLAPEDPSRSKYGKLVTPAQYEASWKMTEAGISNLIDLMQRDLDLTNFRFIKTYYQLAVAAHYMATHPSAGKGEIDLLRQWLILSVVGGRYHERSASNYAPT